MRDNMGNRGRTQQVTVEDMVEIANGLDRPWFTAADIADQTAIGRERVGQILRPYADNSDVLERDMAGTTWVYWFE